MSSKMPKTLLGDIFGGLTAGVVALPLALAFGITSGLPTEIAAVAGLYGAIAVGVLAAVFGGTPTQISGPTGPMTVVSATVIASAAAHGAEIDLAFIFGTFALAGLLQIVMGFARLGGFVRFIPHPVVSGFMTGIGVIIILLQVFPMFGHPSPSSPLAVIQRVAEPLRDIQFPALAVTLATIAIIYTFPKITKKVPGALVALIVMSIVTTVLGIKVAVIGAIPTGLPELHLDMPNFETFLRMLPPAISLAALGAIDSLLTSLVADNITRTRHDSNRELIGQGIGNFVGGIIGGLPGAGATMRTVVNVNSGGRTRLSGLIHGLLLLAILLGLGPLAAQVPKPVLAGILLTVGISIIDYKGLRELSRMPRIDAAVLLTVLSLTVFVDLLWAVALGITMSAMAFIREMSLYTEKSAQVSALDEIDPDLESDVGKKIYVKELGGPLFFGVATELIGLAEKVPPTDIVIFHMKRAHYLDHSGLVALDEVISRLRERNVVVALAAVDDQPRNLFELLHVVPNLVPSELVFPDLDTARNAALEAVRTGQPLYSNES